MVAKPGVGSMVEGSHALATNLLAAYLFNEGGGTSAADSTGHGHTLTLNLTAIAWGLSTLFTGSSPALICSATTGSTGGTLSPGLAGTTFSVEVWVTYQTGDTYATLLSANAGSQVLYVHGGKLDAYLTAGGDHDGGTTLSAGSSYQLCLTYDGTNARLYVNAALDLTTAVTYASLSPAFIINGAGTQTFIGTYDILRIWAGRILTGAEIGTLYTDPFDMYTAAPPFLTPALLRRAMARVSLDAPALAEGPRFPRGVLAALGITALPWWLDGVNIGKGFDRG